MEVKSKALSILITDAQELAGMGAVRSLGRAGHKVFAVSPHGIGRPACAWSRWCAGELQGPDPWLFQAEFREWLLEQLRGGDFDAVVAVSEASLIALAAIRAKGTAAGVPAGVIMPLPSDAALHTTLSKFYSTQLAISLGIECPPTIFLDSARPIAEQTSELDVLRYPIIIKIDNHLAANGIYIKGRNFMAAHRAEAMRVLHELEEVPTRVIVQELIPGSGSGSFFLRHGGTVRLEFAHRRLHEVPWSGGYSSYRESCHDQRVIERGRRLLEAIDYEGVAMVEFRNHRDDDQPFFLEINGRLWGSLALMLHCGVDFPRALIECYSQGGTSPAGPSPARPGQTWPHYRAGVKCRNVYPGELSHLVSIIKADAAEEIEPAPNKLGALGRFILLTLNPMVRHDHFWWSDPMPGVVQAANGVLLVTRRGIERAIEALKGRSDALTLARLRLRHRLRDARGYYFVTPPRRILFLCYGNLCRGPFAAAYWNARVNGHGDGDGDGQTLPQAVSAGLYSKTGRAVPEVIARLADEFTVDLRGHRSVAVNRRDVEAADAIFVMDLSNYRELIEQYPCARAKTWLLGLFGPGDPGRGLQIEDPYLMEPREARGCYQQLTSASLDGLLSRMK